MKLGLANYKFQTGQEDVPLDKLQVMPIPGKDHRALRATVQPPSSRDGPREKEAETERPGEETEGGEKAMNIEQATDVEKPVLPAVPYERVADDDSTTVCGGVASSLLSLARSSSSVSASS